MGALWLADQWREALYYAERRGTLHVYAGLPFVPNLAERAVWANVHRVVGGDGREKRAQFQRGLLLPEQQLPLLDAARSLGYAGLQLKDRTERIHQSVALFEPDRATYVGRLGAREMHGLVRRSRLEGERAELNSSLALKSFKGKTEYELSHRDRQCRPGRDF